MIGNTFLDYDLDLYFYSNPKTVLATAGFYSQLYNPALEVGSLIPSHQAQQSDPIFDFSPTFFPDTEQYDPDLEFGSPFSVAQAQQYDFPLHSELPEAIKHSEYYSSGLISASEGFKPTFNPLPIAAFHDTGIDYGIPDSSEYSWRYGPRITPALHEGSEYQQQDPRLYSTMTEGFQPFFQHNLITIQKAATHRGLDSCPEAVLSSSGFQAEMHNPEGDSLDGFLQSFTGPIPEAREEPGLAIRESECSVDAAERNVWHVAMNKHGVYRPSGELRLSEDGILQWREHETDRWCKYSQPSDEIYTY